MSRLAAKPGVSSPAPVAEVAIPGGRDGSPALGGLRQGRAVNKVEISDKFSNIDSPPRFQNLHPPCCLPVTPARRATILIVPVNYRAVKVLPNEYYVTGDDLMITTVLELLCGRVHPRSADRRGWQ